MLDDDQSRGQEAQGLLVTAGAKEKGRVAITWSSDMAWICDMLARASRLNRLGE